MRNPARRFKIGNHWVGEGEACFIIAEAGSNHNGSFEQAIAMIDVAAEAGADAVKFQSFQAKKLYPYTHKKVAYLKKLGINKSIFDIIRQMEMPKDWIPRLAAYCNRKGIIFMSSPFDEEMVDALTPFVPVFKVASYELTHLPLIKYIAKKGKPLILSTGAATLDEIKAVVKEVLKTGNTKISLTQCTAKYPAPLESINLRVLDTLRTETGCLVGLSDHSRSPIYAPLAAVAVGAAFVEKHFTISNRLPGPDHSFALEPDELKGMVLGIRAVESAMGDSHKILQGVEKELVNYRRAIFTDKNINKGQTIYKRDVSILRKPGLSVKGISPEEIECVIGSRAVRDLKKGKCLEKGDLMR
ncbi:MAG: N-acetylneuraminate synthase family protein [Candidatus Margulisbacteria bacterium]|nr:N-acetylneuraminate synthase family protein [Candidatus Margulisiibacteriota bacterium]MBU1021518.1 N-acetylneuraminate synthase family protein [Candidatus Margulisiibacteriota bacterium]MBU1728603.1 N-acetylneuraminate synthase family protein [Candidatus Margulisiibacteriota bacterium]MBU1955818.1 N-acetylneuraminate synthase family protein [Candidatus Margulisiibacteriota bacterium]